jgi:aminopeptidase C
MRERAAEDKRSKSRRPIAKTKKTPNNAPSADQNQLWSSTFVSPVDIEHSSEQLASPSDRYFALLQNTFTNVPLKYVKPAGVIINKNFSVELPELPVQDQQTSGRCWIFSGINVLRRLIIDRYGPRKVTTDYNLSHSFLFFYSWLEKCNSALELAYHFFLEDRLPSAEYALTMTGVLGDGGTWESFISLIEKYGVVPNYAYPDSRPAKASNELNDVMVSIVRHAIAKLLMSRSDANRETFALIKEEAMSMVYAR